MKLFLDFFPVAIFVAVYHFYGIYSAVAVMMIIYPLQFIFTWIFTKKMDKTLLFTAITVLLLGTATLVFHNDTFFKWKPTIIYWIFSFALLGSQIIGKKVLIERLLGHTLTLSQPWWRHLNISWAVFFLVLGFVNLIIVYTCSTTTWVYFKLFGLLAITVLFLIGQIAYLNWRGALSQNS